MDNVFELESLYPKSMQDTYIKGQMANNMDKNFVQRIMRGTPNTVPSQLNMDGSRSTHLMSSGDEYMFPDIIYKSPALGRGGFVKNTAKSHEYIKLPNSNMAQWLGMNYKRANPEMFVPKRIANIEESIIGGY